MEKVLSQSEIDELFRAAQNQAAASAYGSGSNGNSAAGARAVHGAANRADTGAQNDVVGLEPIYGHS